MDGPGEAFFADYYNNVIRKITPGGMITTVAGDNAKGPGYSGDGGPATLAQFTTRKRLRWMRPAISTSQTRANRAM